MTAAATRAANAIAAQGLVACNTTDASERAAIEAIAAIVDAEIQPLLDALHGLLSVIDDSRHPWAFQCRETTAYSQACAARRNARRTDP